MTGIYAELLTVPQEAGPDLRLRSFSNHEYSGYETPDGSTVVYDLALGLFCYARLSMPGETSVDDSEPARSAQRDLHGLWQSRDRLVTFTP